jgi:hypothetical protein
MVRTLDMRVLFLGAMALALVTWDHPRANDGGVEAKRAKDGSIAIEIVYQAPEACWSIVSTAAGAPKGEFPPLTAAPATVKLKRADGLCAQMITPIKASFSVPKMANANSVIVYVTGQDGKVLATPEAPIR